MNRNPVTLQIKCGVCNRITNVQQTYLPKDNGFKYCNNLNCKATIVHIDGRFANLKNGSKLERLIA